MYLVVVVLVGGYYGPVCMHGFKRSNVCFDFLEERREKKKRQTKLRKVGYGVGSIDWAKANVYVWSVRERNI